MSSEKHTRPLSGTAAVGLRSYPTQKGSVAAVVYPEEFSGSNAVDRYRQGVNVRSINYLYSHIGMKHQPINDLHKVRSGKIIFDWIEHLCSEKHWKHTCIQHRAPGSTAILNIFERCHD